MKKIAIGLFLAVLIGAAGLPYYMGITAKQSLDKYIDYVNEQSPLLKFRVDNYKRGWFRSEADIDMTFINQHHSGRKTPINFSFKEVIHHGPILIDKGFKIARAYFETKVSFSEKTLDKIKRKVTFEPKEPKIVSDTQLDLSGDYNGYFAIEPFKMISKRRDDMYFDWKGLDITGMISNDFSKANGKVELTGMTLTGKDSTFVMGPFTLDYKLKQEREHLWTGDMKFKQKDVVATKNEKDIFKLDTMELKTSTNLHEDMLSYDFFFNMSPILVKAKTYGPFDMSVGIKNLDAQTLAQIQKNVEKANNPSLSAAEKQMIMMALMPSLPNMITQKSEINIDADFSVPEGKITTKGYVKLDGKSSGAINMMTLQRSLLVDLEAKAPVEIVRYFARLDAIKKLKRKQMRQATYSHENAPEGMEPPKKIDIKAEADNVAVQQMQQWEKMGFIVREGNTYRIKLVVDGGHLNLNGRPMY